MGKITALAVVFLTLSAYSETVYQNDFASRSSLKPVPAIGKWVRYDYTAGKSLAYSYGKTQLQYTENLPWSIPAKMQDGWINGAYGTWHPGSYVTNNVDSDTSRPFAAFDLNNDTTYYKGILYHPIDNSFSNGTLTCWIDMRVPTSWGIDGSGETPMLRFFPAYRTFLENPDGLSNAYTFPAICGIQGTSCVRFFGFTTTSTGAAGLSGAFYNKSKISAGTWVRFRMEVNLDSKTTSCSVWTLGTTVPAWDEVGTDELQENNRYLYRFPTAERGPVEGIGLYVAGVKSKGDVRKMPAFTNVRLEWQAPGSAISQPCYSNNFVTCWKRRVTAGTTAHTYAAASPHVVTNSYTPEVGSNSHMTFNNNGYPYLTPDPSNTRKVGVDGWKRCDNNGGAVYAVGTGQLTNTNFLKMCARTNGTAVAGYKFAVVSQTLGEKITSGKVRLSVDGRTPQKWYMSTRGVFVALGNDYLYSEAGTGDYMNYYAARIGVTSPANTTAPHPKYYSSGSVGTDIDTTNVTFRTWQRYVITADLDQKTYDWAIYDIGGGVANRPNPETSVASGTGVSFETDVSDIASFVLLGYGFGDTGTFNDQILFDNIQVWKNWDDSAQTGDLIYYNDFEERRRVVTSDERPLTGKSNVFHPDCDSWVRRGDCGGRLVIEGDTNPYVSGSGGSENLAFHDLGTHWSAAATRQMTLRVDVRPPDFWYGTESKRALVAIGGGDVAQGDAFGSADPLAKAAIRFGFAPANATKDACGRYTTIAACARNGAADETASFTVSKTSWYRFVVTTRPANGTYDLDIYQQGAHPAVSDANGSLVASYRGLAYGNGSDGDLSAVGLDTSGVRGFTPWDVEDPGCALFDNIVVDRQPYGTSIAIR